MLPCLERWLSLKMPGLAVICFASAWSCFESPVADLHCVTGANVQCCALNLRWSTLRWFDFLQGMKKINTPIPKWHCSLVKRIACRGVHYAKRTSSFSGQKTLNSSWHSFSFHFRTHLSWGNAAFATKNQPVKYGRGRGVGWGTGGVSGPKPESGCDLKYAMVYFVADTIPNLLSTGRPSPFIFHKIPHTQQQSLTAKMQSTQVISWCTSIPDSS